MIYKISRMILTQFELRKIYYKYMWATTENLSIFEIILGGIVIIWQPACSACTMFKTSLGLAHNILTFGNSFCIYSANLLCLGLLEVRIIIL